MLGVACESATRHSILQPFDVPLFPDKSGGVEMKLASMPPRAADEGAIPEGRAEAIPLFILAGDEVDDEVGQLVW